MMRIFITGLCGNLGRQLSQEAVEQGHTVAGVDRADWPISEARPERMELTVCDLEDYATVRRAMDGAEALVHTAGLHMVNATEGSLGDFLHSNVEVTARLMCLAVELRLRRFVLCSSMTVVVGPPPLLEEGGLAVLDEQQPPHTGHPYPTSKLLMEALGQEFSRHHSVSVASLRFMAFGHGHEEAVPNLLARFVSVRDAARACLLALARDELRGEVFHIGSGTPLTNALICLAQRDPAKTLEHLYPGSVAVLQALGYGLKPEDFWPVASIVKARCVLGYEPLFTFQNWLRQHGWKPQAQPGA